MYDSNDFVDWFSSMTGMSGTNSNDKSWTDADELNSLWESYNSYVQDLKTEGYKIFRNEQGKHKVIKNTKTDFA